MNKKDKRKYKRTVKKYWLIQELLCETLENEKRNVLLSGLTVVYVSAAMMIFNDLYYVPGFSLSFLI